jgi:hypothetical protein
MSDDVLSRLHKELEGPTANSPAVCELLCEAAEEIERLRVRLAARERFLKDLLAARDKRGEQGDDDGTPEVVLRGPPKTPRGGSPAFATRLDARDEMTPGVQNEVPRRGLVEQPETGH